MSSEISILLDLAGNAGVGNFIKQQLGISGTVDITDIGKITGLLREREISYVYNFVVSWYKETGTEERGEVSIATSQARGVPSGIFKINSLANADIARGMAYALVDMLVEAKSRLNAGVISEAEYESIIAVKSQ